MGWMDALKLFTSGGILAPKKPELAGKIGRYTQPLSSLVRAGREVCVHC